MVNGGSISKAGILVGFVLVLASIAVLIIKPWQGNKGGICYIDYNDTKIPVAFCYDFVKDIIVNITNYNGSQIINASNYKLVFFYPEYTGNYSVALLNLYLKFNKTIPVCLYNYENCKFYTNMSIDDICSKDKIKILYNDKMYDLYMIEFPSNITVPIILNLSYNIGVFEYNNCIIVSGDTKDIRRVVSRFAYWVYEEK